MLFGELRSTSAMNKYYQEHKDEAAEIEVAVQEELDALAAAADPPLDPQEVSNQRAGIRQKLKAAEWREKDDEIKGEYADKVGPPRMSTYVFTTLSSSA